MQAASNFSSVTTQLTANTTRENRGKFSLPLNLRPNLDGKISRPKPGDCTGEKLSRATFFCCYACIRATVTTVLAHSSSRQILSPISPFPLIPEMSLVERNSDEWSRFWPMQTILSGKTISYVSDPVYPLSPPISSPIELRPFRYDATSNMGRATTEPVITKRFLTILSLPYLCSRSPTQTWPTTAEITDLKRRIQDGVRSQAWSGCSFQA